jgi:hypothetical protein
MVACEQKVAEKTCAKKGNPNRAKIGLTSQKPTLSGMVLVPLPVGEYKGVNFQGGPEGLRVSCAATGRWDLRR